MWKQMFQITFLTKVMNWEYIIRMFLFLWSRCWWWSVANLRYDREVCIAYNYIIKFVWILINQSVIWTRYTLARCVDIWILVWRSHLIALHRKKNANGKSNKTVLKLLCIHVCVAHTLENWMKLKYFKCLIKVKEPFEFLYKYLNYWEQFLIKTIDVQKSLYNKMLSKTNKANTKQNEWKNKHVFIKTTYVTTDFIVV